MAKRLGFGVGAGAGLASLGEAVTAAGLQQNRLTTQRENQLLGEQATTLREMTDRVAKGEVAPDQAEAALRAQGIGVPRGHFANVEPSVSSRVQSVMKGIEDADSYQKVPGETALTAQVKAARLPVTLGKTAMSTPESVASSGNLPSTQFGPTSPASDAVFAARREKLGSFPPIKQSETLPSGETRETFLDSNPATLRGQTFTTGLSAEQQGKNKLAEFAQNEGSPARANLTTEMANIVERGTRGEKIKTSAATAAADTSARMRTQFAEEAKQYGLTAAQTNTGLKLRDDFTKESANFYVREEEIRKIGGLSKMRNPDGTGQPMADLGLVFSYMKMLDPSSSVREGEQAKVENARAVPDTIRALYNKLLGSGAPLDEAQRTGIVQAAARLYQEDRAGHQERVQRYSADAQRLNIPPNLVTRPPSASADTAAQSPLDLLRQRGGGR